MKKGTKKDGVKKASELIDEIFSSLSYGNKKSYVSIFRKWDEIAGHDLAAHARLAEIEDDVLLVETDHPAWSQMISLQKKKIVGRIEKEFPELHIRDIRVMLK
jgi:hypothetical protein